MEKLIIVEKDNKKYVEYKNRRLSVDVTRQWVNTAEDIFDMHPAARGEGASEKTTFRVGTLTYSTVLDADNSVATYSFYAEDRDSDRFEIFVEWSNSRCGGNTVSMGII